MMEFAGANIADQVLISLNLKEKQDLQRLLGLSNHQEVFMESITNKNFNNSIGQDFFSDVGSKNPFVKNN